jgi:membrane-associated protease RseP (regulator of RpoE activity)
MGETSQPETQTTFAVYVGPPLETIRSIVASQFHVKDAFLDPYGVPTVQITAEPVKEKFKTLLSQLAEHRLVAAIRGSGDTLTIKTFQKPQIRTPRRIINLVLFLATVATVFGAGYLLWTVFDIAAPEANSYLMGAQFAVGLMAIIGLHEFGHQAAARHHKLEATLPYFIPGPPPFVPFGTFGALISLKEPPANRDQLFDLGLSGPLVGFIITIIVGVVAVAIGLPLDEAQQDVLRSQGVRFISGWPDVPALFILMDRALGFLRPDIGPNTILYSQFAQAAQIGALLTFLNLIPAWQLDGGHISRAVFGPEGLRVVTIVGVIALFVTGYYSFAILLLIFMSFSRRGSTGVEPLDDISPISNSRKILYLLGLVTLGLTFSLSPF